MNHNIRAPAYSMKSRSRTKLEDIGPGPNAYILPTTIGPKIPDKIAQGAFSLYVYKFEIIIEKLCLKLCLDLQQYSL
ncbi:hypothetical protein K0M31_019558 [Melipona bicolor]|uniref:Uncharacterized protein n=1 Tax=Melipona bicolor TaxID=60889 RepID=A0AA40G2L4_9HYME|nr:hypothetical protein K0M31_019558 [Melipona bicolor]